MQDGKPPPAADERRRSIRFPAQVATVGLCLRTTARVINESRDGIALVVDEKTKLHHGQQVSIDYGGVEMPAIVRRVDQRIDGGSVVGLEWQAS